MAGEEKNAPDPHGGREVLEDEREREADQREALADEREREADQREAFGG